MKRMDFHETIIVWVPLIIRNLIMKIYHTLKQGKFTTIRPTSWRQFYQTYHGQQ